jgi:hypothetical protein
MFPQRNPPVIFLEMPSVSELSLANLHHVLGLYLPVPSLPLAGEDLREFAHANSLAAPQGGPGYDSCRG